MTTYPGRLVTSPSTASPFQGRLGQIKVKAIVSPQQVYAERAAAGLPCAILRRGIYHLAALGYLLLLQGSGRGDAHVVVRPRGSDGGV